MEISKIWESLYSIDIGTACTDILFSEFRWTHFSAQTAWRICLQLKHGSRRIGTVALCLSSKVNIELRMKEGSKMMKIMHRTIYR